jgi:hypothetical protein
VIKDPGRLAHNAVDPRLRVRAGERIQHHRPDPSQSQFAGQHQPVWAGPGDDDLNHGASLVVDIGITTAIVIGATRNECRHHATAHKDRRREGRGHRTSRVTGTLRGGLCAAGDGESGCCLRCQSLSLVGAKRIAAPRPSSHHFTSSPQVDTTRLDVVRVGMPIIFGDRD